MTDDEMTKAPKCVICGSDTADGGLCNDHKYDEQADPRIVGLKEALVVIAELAKAWPEDIFGPPLTPEEWQQVRSAGIRTERIGSECYRHALRVASSHIKEVIADHSEPT